jgi:hypothetical protein
LRTILISIVLRLAVRLTQSPSPGVKREELEADHSLTSTAEVENGGTCLHGVVLIN